MNLNKYTKKALENKVQMLNEQRQNALSKRDKLQITSSTNYYISKLAILDQNPNLTTIEA